MEQPRPAGHQAPAAPLVDGMATPPADSRSKRFEISGSLREHAARGTLINTAFLTGLSALSLLKGFILAGFISRADYGLWGVLAVSLGTLLWLKQVGITDKYVEQDEEDQELAFQKAFTLELCFTGGFVVLLAAALPGFALLYGLPELIAPGLLVLVALVAQIFQTPLWVFYRRMQFARQRSLQAIDPVVGFVVSIALAAAGLGYWALVIGLVAGACASALAAVAFSPFKLRLRYEGGTMRSYASFSWPLFVSSGASIVMAQSAILAAEGHLGLAATGVLALAATITTFTDRVDQLVTGTLYPAICAVKDRTALLYESFVKSNRLALMWAVPFGTALTLFAADLVDFGIGDRWEPAVVVLQVYGIAAAVGHVGFNWNAYFRARAETRPMAVASLAAMVTFLAVGLPLLFTDGLRGFAIGVAAQTVVHVLFRAYYLQRLFDGFAFLRHAGRAFLPTVPAVAVVLVLRMAESGERTLVMALGELGLYVIVTAAATWYFESRLLREAIGYLTARRRPARAGA
jgi:O-antigen/teichoic acid export membrane protein